MTLRDLLPPHRIEPLGIAFLYTVAAAMLFAATINPIELPAVFGYMAWGAAVALFAIPWTPSSSQRATASGVVAFVLLGRIAYLILEAGALTGATLWGAVFWGVLLALSRDQDQSFRQKIRK